MNPFKAFVINQDADRKVLASMATLAPEQLDAGEVTIRVHYSSINYKDALAATGAGRIIRRFPCVGGIDLAGEVVESADARFKAPAFPGDRLELEVEQEAAFGALRRVKGRVTCEGRLLCSATLVLARRPA